MSSYCVDCGAPIPEAQRVCSMCYGDMDFGRDGYYRAWAEEQMQRDAEEREAAERQAEREAQEGEGTR